MPPASQRASTPGILSLILGIASIPLVFCFVLGLPAGVAAIILGAIALQRSRQEPDVSRWQPLVGIVCGAIGLVAIIIVILLPN